MTITGVTDLINTLEDGGKNTALEVRTILNAIRDEVFKIKEVKELDVDLTSDPSFLIDNFDSSGLGIGDFLGWARCNGNNGTRNRGGRTSIGYDETNYPTIGAVGGEKNHVLTTAEMPTHSHSVAYDLHNAGGSGSEATLDIDGGGTSGTKQTNTTGGGAAHNNMQPYIVTLFIQRVA